MLTYLTVTLHKLEMAFIVISTKKHPKVQVLETLARFGMILPLEIYVSSSFRQIDYRKMIRSNIYIFLVKQDGLDQHSDQTEGCCQYRTQNNYLWKIHEILINGFKRSDKLHCLQAPIYTAFGSPNTNCTANFGKPYFFFV